VLFSLSTAMIVSLALRQSVKVDVIRDRASLSRIVAGGKLENVYRLQIMNATEQAQRYRISAHGLDGLELASDQEVEVGPAETRGIAARLQIPYGSAEPGSHTVFFDIDALQAGAGRTSEKAVFLVPR
jgi:polyferredoxin